MSNKNYNHERFSKARDIGFKTNGNGMITNRLLYLLWIVIFWSCTPRLAEKQADKQLPDSLKYFTNPIIANGADPWVIKDDSLYYFCFAGGGPGGTSAITVSKSKLLTEPGKRKLVWHAEENAWNRRNLWAPELHKIGDKWYIYYTAGKGGPPFINQRSGVLESLTNDPQGEYREKGILQTGNDSNDYVSTIWAIDLTVTEINGKLYAIWSGWDKNENTDKTPQHLFIAEMSNPYTISSPRSKIAMAEEPWETGGSLDLIEGPQVLKHDGKTLIIYSTRESWMKEYRLGQLRLIDSTKSPLHAENWVKNGPVFQGTDEVFGTGHASFTTSPDGKEWWILYHAKKSDKPGWQRDVRLQKFTWNNSGIPVFGKPVPAGVKMKRPSGEAEIMYKEKKQEELKSQKTTEHAHF